jgi:hypothetical protein
MYTIHEAVSKFPAENLFPNRKNLSESSGNGPPSGKDFGESTRHLDAETHSLYNLS